MTGPMHARDVGTPPSPKSPSEPLLKGPPPAWTPVRATMRANQPAGGLLNKVVTGQPLDAVLAAELVAVDGGVKASLSSGSAFCCPSEPDVQLRGGIWRAVEDDLVPGGQQVEEALQPTLWGSRRSA